MSESKWKQIVGKTISEGAYVSSESLREDYARAMNETCFRTDLDYMRKRQETSERIMSKIMTHEPLTDEDTADIKRYNLQIRQIRKERTQTNGGEMTDCEFEQIGETQLLSYLKAGWQIVHRLENGKVIVKR